MKYQSVIKRVATKPHYISGETFCLRDVSGEPYVVHNIDLSVYEREILEKYTSGSVQVLLLTDIGACFVIDPRISQDLFN
jgi:hypothetical protein